MPIPPATYDFARGRPPTAPSTTCGSRGSTFRNGGPARREAASAAAGAGPPRGTGLAKGCLTAFAVAAALFSACGCSRSAVSKVAAAIRAKYPDGKPRCLGLGGAVGIHVPVPPRGTLWYPASGPTSPLVHLFVFWAGPAAAVPELVADLAGRGILARTTVQATVDVETTEYGLRQASGYSAADQHEHRRGSFAVDIYTTRPFDPDFDYARQLNFTPSLVSNASFPSRLYGDGPLPPPDRHYSIPTIDPYATNVVDSACFPETVDRVEEVRAKVDGFGDPYLEADVLFDEHPREWMLTRTFQRAAMAPDTDPITRPRRATVVLGEKGGTLSFVREQWK